MAALDAWQVWSFVTILILTFALFLLITGLFTAYFGSGKSRKIGAGLLVGGLVVGIVWAYYVYSAHPIAGVLSGPVGLGTVVIQAIGVILAAVIGAGAAIGLFLLAIMKS